jgi:hypothetical protein
MANPNRVMAREQARVWQVIDCQNFAAGQTAAETWAREQKAEHPNRRYRVSSYKIGPRNAPVRQYQVHVYEA